MPAKKSQTYGKKKAAKIPAARAIFGVSSPQELKSIVEKCLGTAHPIPGAGLVIKKQVFDPYHDSSCSTQAG